MIKQQLLPKWIMKRYLLLWKELKDKKFDFDTALKVLKEGGLMVLHTKNFIKKGEMVRLDLDTIKLCEAAGFKLKERKYRKHRNVSFWVKNSRKNYYRKNPSELCSDPYADFEDILVFKKEALSNVSKDN